MANEIQKYTFSHVPSYGSWKPVYDGTASTGFINDAATGSEIRAYLNQIPALATDNTSTTGSYAAGMTVEFVGGLANTDMLTLSYQDNTLVYAGSVSISTIQNGGVGVNEIQRISTTGTDGSFVLGVTELGTNPTLTLPLTTGGIEASFAAVFCTVTCTVDGDGFLIEFSGAPLTETDVTQMTLASNSTTIPITISVSVIQEGVPLPPGGAKTRMMTGVG